MATIINDPPYTFDSFISAPSNQLALAACKEISGKDEIKYNPLYIYGDEGVGKTHLLRCIAYERMKRSLFDGLVFFSVHDYIHDINTENDNAKSYLGERKPGIWLIDDFEEFDGHTGEGRLLIECLNERIIKGLSVVIAGRCAPEDLLNCSDCIKKYLSSGLVVNIKEPDIATKTVILKKRILSCGYDPMLLQSVIDDITAMPELNTRQMLNKLIEEYLITSGDPRY